MRWIVPRFAGSRRAVMAPALSAVISGNYKSTDQTADDETA